MGLLYLLIKWWFYIVVNLSLVVQAAIRNEREIIATVVYFCHIVAVSLINTDACCRRTLIKIIAMLLVTSSVYIYIYIYIYTYIYKTVYLQFYSFFHDEPLSVWRHVCRQIMSTIVLSNIPALMAVIDLFVSSVLVITIRSCTVSTPWLGLIFRKMASVTYLANIFAVIILWTSSEIRANRKQLSCHTFPWIYSRTSWWHYVKRGTFVFI